MAITQIKRDEAYSPYIVRILSSNTLAEVGTTGYLLAQADEIAALNEGPFEWEVSDLVLLYASDGLGLFIVSEDFESLVAFAFTDSVVGAPVVVGNFAAFQSTSGNLEDLGYLPSDATKTRVVMASAAVTANALAVFADTTGTIKNQSTTATLAFGLTMASGNLSLTLGYVLGSAANALTAHAGGGQAAALQLAKQINRVTIVGTAGDSVKLPVSLAGMQVVVINAAAANAMDVFGQTGDVINALPANTALSLVANTSAMFNCAVAGTWNALVTG